MMKVKPVKLEDLKKGDLILVKWIDASDIKGSLTEHESKPEVHVKDWGIFLGVSGRMHRFLIIGKDVTEVHNDWGATGYQWTSSRRSCSSCPGTTSSGTSPRSRSWAQGALGSANTGGR
jgi:hypothetical protein